VDKGDEMPESAVVGWTEKQFENFLLQESGMSDELCRKTAKLFTKYALLIIVRTANPIDYEEE
jgi:hypothetical protein